MLDNLFRPLITSKMLKEILDTRDSRWVAEKEQEKPEDFWVKVSFGSNYIMMILFVWSICKAV